MTVSEPLVSGTVLIRRLGRRDYPPVFEAMKTFTNHRDERTLDEFWVVEHEPVFTQGLAGKPEHLLAPGDIPVIQVDRGGQVTYHGPGQVVVYFLLDARRAGLGVRRLVTLLERSVIQLLEAYGVTAYARPEAPGVYVADAKVASLGLRIRRGCAYHGLSVNVDMDLAPFARINPCGYPGLRVTQLKALGILRDTGQVAADLLRILINLFGYTVVQSADTLPTFTLQEAVHAR